MSDRNREENDRTPVSLDKVLVEVGRDLAREVRRPDEATIIAYFSGTANELQIREVRAAVVCSPEFRGDLIELKKTMDELAAPGVTERFDRLEVGVTPRFESILPGKSRAAQISVHRAGWHTWFDVARSLLRKPAYVYALLLALSAYPVYRALLPGQPPRPEISGPVIQPVDLFLREDPRGVMRGEADRPRLPVLEVEATASIVQLALEVPRASTSESWHASLADESGVIWRSGIPRRVYTVDEDRVVLLELDPRAIDPGVVTIVLEEAAARPDASPAVYRFTLAKRE